MDYAQKAGGKTVTGIVCEYNPFHSGHAWMIDRLRENGTGLVVCVMSGPFVQRAEGACLPTYLRARAAVLGGADLVFRLPVASAAASAEGFAHGAVGLLVALGCVDEIAFGAETADTGLLTQVAALISTPAFQAELREELKEGESYAKVRAAVAQRHLPGAEALLASPNNILAVEYCKAIVRGFSFKNPAENRPLPKPLALPRKGARHDGRPEGGIASASWLRQQAAHLGVEALEAFVPKACYTLYQKAKREGDWLDAARYELVMLARLRGLSADQFARHPGAGEGLENRLAAAARSAVSLEGLYAAAKTKRYAHSRVRRLALSAALGLPKNPPGVPPFLHLLAASQPGLALLKEAKQTAALPVSTSLAKLAKTGEVALRAAALEARAEDLHALCLQKPKPGGGAFTHPVQLLPGTQGREPV